MAKQVSFIPTKTKVFFITEDHNLFETGEIVNVNIREYGSEIKTSYTIKYKTNGAYKEAIQKERFVFEKLEELTQFVEKELKKLND